MSIKERLHARRVSRWSSQADACSDQITRLSVQLQNTDQIKDWWLAHQIREERARAWERRNDLYTKLTQE